MLRASSTVVVGGTVFGPRSITSRTSGPASAVGMNLVLMPSRYATHAGKRAMAPVAAQRREALMSEAAAWRRRSRGRPRAVPRRIARDAGLTRATGDHRHPIRHHLRGLL